MTSIDTVYKTFQVLKEMLNDRQINTERIDTIEVPELKALAKQNSIIVLDVNDDLRVLYTLSKFKYSDFKKYLSEKEIKHVIIITKEKLSSTNHKSFDNHPETDFEFFIIKELLFNISKNNYVPLHEIVRDPKLIEDIISKHKIKTKTQLPLIDKNDPMARYLHAKPGDIIRVTRNSISSGIAYIYRYCI